MHNHGFGRLRAPSALAAAAALFTVAWILARPGSAWALCLVLTGALAAVRWRERALATERLAPLGASVTACLTVAGASPNVLFAVALTGLALVIPATLLLLRLAGEPVPPSGAVVFYLLFSLGFALAYSIYGTQVGGPATLMPLVVLAVQLELCGNAIGQWLGAPVHAAVVMGYTSGCCAVALLGDSPRISVCLTGPMAWALAALVRSPDAPWNRR